VRVGRMREEKAPGFGVENAKNGQYAAGRFRAGRPGMELAFFPGNVIRRLQLNDLRSYRGTHRLHDGHRVRKNCA